MGTTEEKLQKLMQTKDDIKTAINGSGNTVGDKFSDYPVAITEGKAYIAQKITEKGVAASGNDTFQQLGDKVGEIQSGGNTETVVVKNYARRNFIYLFSDGQTSFPILFGVGNITIPKGSCFTENGGGGMFTITGDYEDIGIKQVEGESFYVYKALGDITIKEEEEIPTL